VEQYASMIDKLSITIKDVYGSNPTTYKYDEFKAYSVEMSRYSLSNAFTIILTKRADNITIGSTIKLAINGKDFMYGMIEKINERYDKTTHDITISGRDLTGLMVDEHFKPSHSSLDPPWGSRSVAVTISDMIKKTPYPQAWNKTYGLSSIPASRMIHDSMSPAGAFSSSDVGYIIDSSVDKLVFDVGVQINPGDKVWDKVLEICKLYYVRIYYESNIQCIVFTTKVASNLMENKFKFTCVKGYKGNNVISCEFDRDITGRYRNNWITGQRDDFVNFDTQDVVDETMLVPKTKTIVYRGFLTDIVSMIKDDISIQRVKGYSLKYLVSGHTQNGKIYGTTDLATVQDDLLGINDTLAINDIKFMFDMDNGVRTEIVLNPVRNDEMSYSEPALQKKWGDNTLTVAGDTIPVNAYWGGLDTNTYGKDELQ
jgi:prophage tail gpP-like protein